MLALRTQIRGSKVILLSYSWYIFSYYLHIFVKTSFSSLSIRTIFTRLHAGALDASVGAIGTEFWHLMDHVLHPVQPIFIYLYVYYGAGWHRNIHLHCTTFPQRKLFSLLVATHSDHFQKYRFPSELHTYSSDVGVLPR